MLSTDSSACTNIFCGDCIHLNNLVKNFSLSVLFSSSNSSLSSWRRLFSASKARSSPIIFNLSINSFLVSVAPLSIEVSGLIFLLISWKSTLSLATFLFLSANLTPPISSTVSSSSSLLLILFNLNLFLKSLSSELRSLAGVGGGLPLLGVPPPKPLTLSEICVVSIEISDKMLAIVSSRS